MVPTCVLLCNLFCIFFPPSAELGKANGSTWELPPAQCFISVLDTKSESLSHESPSIPIWNFLGRYVPTDSPCYTALQLYWRKKTIHLAGHEMGIFLRLLWFEPDPYSPGGTTLCLPAFLF